MSKMISSFHSPTSSKSLSHRLILRNVLRTLGLVLLMGSFVLINPMVVSDAQAQDQQQARERFLEGREFYDAEEYMLAAEAFLEAYELSGRTELLYNVGQAYRNAEAYTEAEKYFQQYLSERPDAPNAEEVVETIIEIQQAAAMAMATLSVRTRPDKLPVYVDDERNPRCTSPCSLTLAAGEYTIHVRPDGFSPARRMITLKASAREELEISLEKTASQGKLLVRTDIRSGTLRVAPHIEQALPLTGPVNVPAGRQTVEVRSGAKVAWRGEIDIAPDETTELFIPMLSLADAQGGASTMRAVAIGLGGGAVAFGVGAILMGLQASDTHAHLESQQESFGAADANLIERGRSQALGTNILWAAAATSIVSGAGIYFWDRTRYKVDAAPRGATAYPDQQTSSTSETGGAGVELLD
ncbi:MAG: PEGA domain-containing protein [Bradymonadaceae bacterium]